jgi:hypothetical protein
LAHLGQHDQATAEATKVLLEKSLDGYNLYNLACIFTVSSAAAHKDVNLSSAERDKQSEQYAARAVNLLTRAQTAGLFALAANVQNLKKDKDLDPLRSRTDYKKLVAEIESQLKSADK